MKVKEYLMGDNPVSLDYIAQKMWPKNRYAKTYLSKKLNGGRPWTTKDEEKAKKILHDLGIALQGL